ncbi:MAG TPA: glycoside hydrolase family 9 protein [Bacteroidales bacterium]|nr:glycoside hydrolase family 9 protein [Bacteroidales bacterium]
MKNALTILCTSLLLMSCAKTENAWIRINQIGYRPGDVKVAVFISTEKAVLKKFDVVEASSGRIVKTFDNQQATAQLDQFISCYRLPLTEFHDTGSFKIVAGRAVSPVFRIADDVYEGAADYLLNYMRQQRCGFNPYLKDSCHMHDGYEVYGKGDSAHIDVTGGWHDAADYLQYVATSANAVYQMLFAYSENPGVFTDNFMDNGLPGSDGIPDVLNESSWGLDWLLKMNPANGVMYNQLADDRDHIGFRSPVGDTADYGKGPERPVYLCTGKPQGLFKYQNRATGIASTAGKFASAFARAALVYQDKNHDLSEILDQKARDAFSYGLEHPGACQTAPGRAPYFYEEDNWTDDMELAAIELYKLTGQKKYFDHAVAFGKMEPVTPWMGSDTARHYQYYPFVNMGHPGVASHEKEDGGNTFINFMKKGIDTVRLRAKENPFYVGVPFIWCSNNLVTAFITQAHLYAKISGDNSYAELEAAHRDWLFGCNPWGTSMVVGLPEGGDWPEKSHSSYVVKGGQVYGGLVDGPVYATIFAAHSKYVRLTGEDPYAKFQTSMASYHDDIGDYTSNECTMDGTACLVYYLSEMAPGAPVKNTVMTRGAITRMDTTRREIWLCFTAHDQADGFRTVLSTLGKHNVKASFFLTGDFVRNNPGIVTELKKAGHYIGPHSDKHLLYCSWEKRDSLLVSEKVFTDDLEKNYESLEKMGIKREKATVFLPPYEWHNDSVAGWSKSLGLRLVNISSGTITSQDWTYPRTDGPYYSSDALMKNLLNYESSKGMNGYILLIHPGTDPRRTDKFYNRLDEVLTYLEKKNYTFRSFSEIL